MNIDEMLAGREMDALVAEKVMGYQCVCDEEPCDCPIHAKNDYDTLLPYSTDIAAAWIIVKEYRLIVGPCSDGTSDLWFAAKPNSVTIIPSVAETAPLAICRAALKQMEGRT